MNSDTIVANYLIETPFSIERAAEALAGEQSTGTFLSVPGETDELKARYRARVMELVPLESLSKPSLPGSRSPTTSSENLEVADFVLLAVPDALIGTVAHSVVPKMKSGAMMICLDPAAPFGGQLPTREDVSYFVVHPAHPPIFNDETTMEARRDFFGSNIAKQSIVCALMQSPESDYAKGEQIGIKLFQPILRSHRVTVEQMATLEPVLSETVAATCLSVIREALDETVRRGVPYEAARDFLLGHLNIELAILFDETHWEFSAGCKKAIIDGKSKLIKPDWKKVFERDEMLASVESITGKIIQQVESE